MDEQKTEQGFEITGNAAELFGALAAAQAEFGELRRTATAKIQMKNGGSYEFSYAPLEEVLASVVPALTRHGLWLGQPLSTVNGRSVLRTIVAHKSGGMLSAVVALPASEDVKAFGSTITYLRRYALQALLGISAEEDDDGSASNGDGYERKPRSAPRQQAKPSVTAQDLDLVVKSIARAPDRETLEAIASAQKLRQWSDAQREQIRAEIAGRAQELRGAA